MSTKSHSESNRDAELIPIPTVEISDSDSTGFADLPVLDVRSPGEFSKGHIPAATNAPLFSDCERTEIGTIFKQISPEAAIQRGTNLALAKADDLLDSVRNSIPNNGEFVMHCWRGGMRSQGFARLCVQHGLKPRILLGGYKAYRQAVQRSFLRPLPFVVISGSTGCGKTELLKRLQAAGEQIIDLEFLAGHKGSAFGGICQPIQPTVEQFENLLSESCQALTMDKPVWVEDESRSIGRIVLPEAFWNHFSNSPAIIITSNKPARVERLLDEYGHLPPEDLVAAIGRLRKRLGGQRFQDATNYVESGQVSEAIGIVLEYYDKAYAKALAARPGPLVYPPGLAAPGLGAPGLGAPGLGAQGLAMPIRETELSQLRQLGASLLEAAQS